MLHRLLRDPYYLGLIVYRRGTEEEETFQGRHEPLTDPETFEQVQRLLEEKRVAGERGYRHQHYLKGSVFCGECGRRLTLASLPVKPVSATRTSSVAPASNAKPAPS